MPDYVFLCFSKESIKKEKYIVVSVSYFFILCYPKLSGWNYLITLCLTGWLNNVNLILGGFYWTLSCLLSAAQSWGKTEFNLHSHVRQLANQAHWFPSTCLVIVQQILIIHIWCLKFSHPKQNSLKVQHFQASASATLIKSTCLGNPMANPDSRTGDSSPDRRLRQLL